MKIAGIALGALLVCSSTGLAAEPLPRSDVDRFVKPLIEGERCPSVVVGFIKADGANGVYGYGNVGADTDPVVPDGRTVYEIGSVTKAFTGVLLADMVQRGEVRLDDPVQSLLPAQVKVPKQGEKPITLLDLATHRSGLPRMPDNFQPKDPANPYADYSAEQLYAFVNDLVPTRPTGEAFEYSNLGMGLLGHALARKAGRTYEALLTDRILRPLEMTDTSITLNDGQKKRLAPPHDADGAPASNWDIPTLAGAGALRSTADDMLKFLRAAMATGPDAKKAFAASYEVQARAQGDNDIGLGWHINSKTKMVWHNGQTGGYHAFVAFVPGKAGVVLLTNAGSGYIDPAGAGLLSALLGETAEPPALKPTVKLDPPALEPFVGSYPLAPQFVLNITREDGRLYLQATGQPRVRLYASGEREFYLRAVDARVTFDQPVDGRSPRLVLYQNGAALPGVRQKAP